MARHKKWLLAFCIRKGPLGILRRTRRL